MPPPRIAEEYFSPDIREFIAQLHRHEVLYLIVGGEAVILHGHARLTGDVVFFYSLDRENVERMYSALEAFWDGDVPGLAAAEELAAEGMIVQFGQPPNRIDLINSIDGVSFEEAWVGRLETMMRATPNDLPVLFIGLEALVRNKRASGRPKDLDDLSYLADRE